jgi:hypothetical protein
MAPAREPVGIPERDDMNDAAPLVNQQFRLAARPVGMPVASDWSFTSAPVEPPEEGGVLVKTLALSLDPAMRGWMNEGRSYIAPVGIGEVMRAGGVGIVVASRNASFAPGDHVSGAPGVQQYWWIGDKQVARGDVSKIDLRLGTIPQWLNVLGMPGMTAYFGLHDVGQPKAGETVVVSGAAGAVGQTVGQLAKIAGCRAVGIAGGPDKCRWVVETLGFDACIDYKSEDVKAGLKRDCPNGVDVYFDNVGGEILDLVLTRLALRARIVICGAISQYNNTGPAVGPANYLSLLVNRARMQGMVVFDYAARYRDAIGVLAGHLKSGKLRSREDVVEGFETFPDALLKLFRGENFGKLILKVADS